jgi:MacB-like periplasmic core domain
MLSDLRFRLRSLFRRNAMEAELDQELCFHFEQEVEKHTRAGMTPEEARRRARLTFGGHEQVKEDCREARGTSLLETLLQDIQYSVRVHRKSPSFFIIAALTLALGIGASTAVFSLVNAILLKPLPYPNATRIVMPWRSNLINSIFGSESFPWGQFDFTQLKETVTAFQNLGAFKKDDFNLTGSGNPEHLEGVRASAEFFPALGMAPLLGRTFTAEEDKPGHALVVVLSHRLWESRFAGDPGVLGRIVSLNGFQYTVIGVMPADFSFPNGEGMPKSIDLPKYPQLWVPLALPPAPKQGPTSDLSVIGELKPNMGLAQAKEDLKTFDRRWLDKFPKWKGWFSQVVPLNQQTVAGYSPAFIALAWRSVRGSADCLFKCCRTDA